MSIKKGQKLSDYHREKITEAMNRPEVRAKLSKAAKGRQGCHHSEETKAKMAASQMGEKSHCYGKPAYHGKGGWITLMTGETVWIRSTWEEKMIRYLESHNVIFKVEPQAFPVEFVCDSKIVHGTYRPDVYIPEIDVWIEVKGYWRDDAKAKFEAFKEQYPDEILLLYDEQVLKSLGII